MACAANFFSSRLARSVRQLRLTASRGTKLRRADPGGRAAGARGESVQYRGDAVAEGGARAAERTGAQVVLAGDDAEAKAVAAALAAEAGLAAVDLALKCS